jgi:tellurite resistance protein
MFRRFLGTNAQSPAASTDDHAVPAAGSPGETATVRRIVARLESMPPERARLIASAAYTLARAAHADLEISDDETAAIERELQRDGALDEPTAVLVTEMATAVLVTEMAKLQAKSVGGTEDYVVTREFKALATPEQRLDVMRACFAIGAASGTISAEETAVLNQIAGELDIDASALNGVRSEFHDRLSAVQRIRQVSGRG